LNIPDKVRIGSMDYRIIYVEGPLVDNDKVLFAQIDFNKKTIKIVKDMQDIQGEEESLLHEIQHGIVFERNFNYENNDEETITEETARGWHQVIRDNPGIFKEVADEK
jgi:hypothetical protein